MTKNRPYFWLIFFLLVLDQVTKALVVRHLPLFSVRTVLPGFFSLTHIHNKGAIFGFFSRTDSRLVFIALTAASLVALALVVYYFVKTPASERGIKIALSLILAGALGNLADRLLRGYVVDFLDFYVRNKHWPFFNVADSCITVGALLLLAFFARRKQA